MGPLQLNHNTVLTHGIDAVSAFAVFGVFMGYVPHIAGFLGLIWYLMQMLTWIENRSNAKKKLSRRKTDRK